MRETCFFGRVCFLAETSRASLNNQRSRDQNQNHKILIHGGFTGQKSTGFPFEDHWDRTVWRRTSHAHKRDGRLSKNMHIFVAVPSFYRRYTLSGPRFLRPLCVHQCGRLDVPKRDVLPLYLVQTAGISNTAESRKQTAHCPPPPARKLCVTCPQDFSRLI